MKAIETEFNGHLFRSLLEARWANFFHALDVEYRYEHEGFDLGRGGYYLPDFWLPRLDVWIEIKPVFPTRVERERCELLAAYTRRPAYLTFGDCWLASDDDITGTIAYFPERGTDGAVEDSTYYWAECERCRAVGITFAGFADRIGCGCYPSDSHAGRVEGWHTERIRAAFTIARRFRPGVDRRVQPRERGGV